MRCVFSATFSLLFGLLWAGVTWASGFDVTTAPGVRYEDRATASLAFDLGGVKHTLNFEVEKAQDECQYEGLSINGQTLQQRLHLLSLPARQEDGTAKNVDYLLTRQCVDDAFGRRVTLSDIVFHVADDVMLRVSLSYSQASGDKPQIRRVRMIEITRHIDDADPLPADFTGLLDVGPKSGWTTPEPDVAFHHHNPWHDEKIPSMHIGPPIPSPVSITPSATPTSTESAPSDLTSELQRLELLQAHAAEIEQEVRATQTRIMSIWKADFSHCVSFRCYLKTVMTKIPTFAHLLATHFSHHNHVNATFFSQTAHMNCSDEVERVVSQHTQEQTTLINTSADTTVQHDELDVSVENSTPAAPPPSDSTPSTASDTIRIPASLWTATVSFQTRFKYAYIIASACLISLFLLSLALFLCIRRFRDPRRVVERAARREERLNRALYRKAACKHKFRTRWQQVSRPFRVGSWLDAVKAAKDEWNECKNEKASVVVATSTLPISDDPENGSPIAPQINNLRGAYTLIADLLSRSNRTNGAAAIGVTAATAAVDTSAFAASTESLPAYSLPPPSYRSRQRADSDSVNSTSEQGGSGDSDISIVDGFTGYTRSTNSEPGLARTDSNVESVDVESSVVTLSTRVSMDSGSQR
ncbi:uncharacterized protein AB675_10532 [Cyphellophora attinorum]|uniref:Uncharacterized protein n=1 Tax=Cyphellophora attinorum TaxID=1664694 RepID=A0A0N0NMW3_9EURO|nr:uncharacterized protein AB675_10532 [Phialophora attinorum]KPI40679.1 hypothetical protein AB675_10532 [Phialophora attinorum]